MARHVFRCKASQDSAKRWVTPCVTAQPLRFYGLSGPMPLTCGACAAHVPPACRPRAAHAPLTSLQPICPCRPMPTHFGKSWRSIAPSLAKFGQEFGPSKLWPEVWPRLLCPQRGLAQVLSEVVFPKVDQTLEAEAGRSLTRVSLICQTWPRLAELPIWAGCWPHSVGISPNSAGVVQASAKFD